MEEERAKQLYTTAHNAIANAAMGVVTGDISAETSSHCLTAACAVHLLYAKPDDARAGWLLRCAAMFDGMEKP